MRKLLQRFQRLLRSDAGQTTVEYAVLLALILLACTSGARTLGCSMQEPLNSTANGLNR